MKKLIFLFAFLVAMLPLRKDAQAQKDEIYGVKKTTVTLTGYRQPIPSNVYQKIIVIDNTAGNATVYYCIKQDGIADTVNGISVYPGECTSFYNFTSDTCYVKGASGSVDIYILKGTGRGFQKNSKGNSNYSDSLKRYVQNSDSLTKFSTPASVNTALASYYTKSQDDGRFLHSADSAKYYTTNNLDTSQVAMQNQQNTFAENQKVARLGVGTSSINPQPWLAVGVDNATTSRIVLNGVNTSVNKKRDTDTEATDSASFSVKVSAIGNVSMNAQNGIGVTTFNVDSTGRIYGASYIQAGTDFLTTNQKGNIIGFNSSGTLGIYLNSTADNFLRIRNAGVSTDAIVQLGTLIITNVPTYADNTAALAGGLTAGKIYKTSTGVLMITY